MQTDWNFVLNVLLLAGVSFAIWRIITSKPAGRCKVVNAAVPPAASELATARPAAVDAVMMFLVAQKDNGFRGAELVNTLFACGLRLGNGCLFHRLRDDTSGPVMCTLAAATPSGVFDMQNIHDFNPRGLCIFMEPSGNPVIDRERFDIMHTTATKLGEELDALLLDDEQQPLTAAGIVRYQRKLGEIS